MSVAEITWINSDLASINFKIICVFLWLSKKFQLRNWRVIFHFFHNFSIFFCLILFRLVFSRLRLFPDSACLQKSLITILQMCMDQKRSTSGQKLPQFIELLNFHCKRCKAKAQKSDISASKSEQKKHLKSIKNNTLKATIKLRP